MTSTKYICSIRKSRSGTNYGLKFTGALDNVIQCYVDSSSGLNDEKGHSTTGYVIEMFGDCVSWRTEKQGHVSLFSDECEFIAMSTACLELANLRAS